MTTELRYMILSSSEDINFYAYHCPADCKMAESLRKKMKEVEKSTLVGCMFLYAFENWLNGVDNSNSTQVDYRASMDYFNTFTSSDRELWVKTGNVGMMHVFNPKYSFEICILPIFC